MEGLLLNGSNVHQGQQVDDSQELLSTKLFDTSMLIHHIMGLKKVPKVRLFTNESGMEKRKDIYIFVDFSHFIRSMDKREKHTLLKAIIFTFEFFTSTYNYYLNYF